MVAPGRRSLRRGLAWASLVIAVLVAAVATVGVVSFVSVSDARTKVIDEVDPANVLVAQLLTYYVDQETGVRGYVITNQAEFLQPYRSGVSEAAALLTQLRRLLGSDAGARAQLALVQTRAGAWHSQFADPAVAAVEGGQGSSTAASPANSPTANSPTANTPTANTPTANSLLDHGKSLFDALRSSVAGLQRQLAAERTRSVRRLHQASDRLGGVLIAAVVLLGVIGAGTWLALRRRVVAPLTAVAGDTRRVTAGDLDHRVEVVGPREIAELGADVEGMRQRMLEEVAAVRRSQERLESLNVDLRRSNEQLEQFAYVASHDLQEPLRKVTSFCQLLQERYGGQLDDRADQYIDFAVDGAKRMQVLINDLLAFSRIGRTKDHFEVVPLRACVEAALQNLTTVVEATGAAIEVVTELPSVLGDRGLLVSLFQNLIGNAMKFRDADRPVRVAIRAQAEETAWRIEVEDDGIGIEARFAERIFVIFQRLHGREAYGGTGIGLAMCKKIVEFHGGRIWLDTGYHPGTRFSFTLPGEGPAALAEEVPVEPGQPIDGR